MSRYSLFADNSSDKIEQIYNLFIQKQYGDIVYHSEVEKILGFDRTVSKYGIYVKKAKDRLIEHSKVLKGIPGVGWQVLKPQQVSGFVYRKYIKKTLNMYNYSTEILNNLDKRNLTDVRIQEYNQVKELNSTLKNTTTNIIEESKYYSRKDYYDSLGEDQN